MKAESPIKMFLVALALALACYVLFYWGIEHRRNRKGPWQVTFTNNLSAPELIIDQSFLGITNVHITFVEEPLPTTNGVLQFGEPRPVPYPVPFGRCVFMDTTFLPGTVTLQLFGHEIELLPRVLIINYKEHRWVAHDRIVLNPTNGPASKR